MKILSFIVLATTLSACGAQTTFSTTQAARKSDDPNREIPSGELKNIQDRITAIDSITGIWKGQTEFNSTSGKCLLSLEIARHQHQVRFIASTIPKTSGARCDDIGTASRTLDLDDRSNWIQFSTSRDPSERVAFNIKDHHIGGALRTRVLDIVLRRVDANTLDVSFINVVNSNGIEIGSMFGSGNNKFLSRIQ